MAVIADSYATFIYIRASLAVLTATIRAVRSHLNAVCARLWDGKINATATIRRQAVMVLLTGVVRCSCNACRVAWIKECD